MNTNESGIETTEYPEHTETMRMRINHRERREHREKPEPLSLTPCFSWVLAGPEKTSTVSTVYLPAPLSQRDYVTQPRVGRRAAIIPVVQFLARRLPWVCGPEDPPTLKGLRLFSGFSLFNLVHPFPRLGIDCTKSVGCAAPDAQIRIIEQMLHGRNGTAGVGAEPSDLESYINLTPCRCLLIGQSRQQRQQTIISKVGQDMRCSSSTSVCIWLTEDRAKFWNSSFRNWSEGPQSHLCAIRKDLFFVRKFPVGVEPFYYRIDGSIQFDLPGRRRVPNPLEQKRNCVGF